MNRKQVIIQVYLKAIYNFVFQKSHKLLEISKLFWSFSQVCSIKTEKINNNILEVNQILYSLFLLQFTSINIINMDPRVTKIMEDVMQGFTNDLNQFSQKCDQKMGSFFQSCFAKTSSNSQKFADCLKEKQDKLTKLIAPMEAKLSIYFPKRANMCLNQSKKSVPECSEQVRSGIRQVLENAKRQVERI